MRPENDDSFDPNVLPRQPFNDNADDSSPQVFFFLRGIAAGVAAAADAHALVRKHQASAAQRMTDKAIEAAIRRWFTSSVQAARMGAVARTPTEAIFEAAVQQGFVPVVEVGFAAGVCREFVRLGRPAGDDPCPFDVGRGLAFAWASRLPESAKREMTASQIVATMTRALGRVEDDVVKAILASNVRGAGLRLVEGLDAGVALAARCSSIPARHPLLRISRGRATTSRPT